MPKNKKILIIAGPTGVGESTITKKIIKQFPIFKRLITATTRDPREGEKNKTDYYFFSTTRFKQEIENGNILEYQNSRDKNTFYGTYKPELEKKLTAGSNIIMNPDIVGAKFFKKHYNATTIFIMPDSMENLEKRHQNRASDSKEELKKRLDYAKREIQEESDFYDYKVVNKQNCLNKTIKTIIERDFI